MEKDGENRGLTYRTYLLGPYRLRPAITKDSKKTTTPGWDIERNLPWEEKIPSLKQDCTPFILPNTTPPLHKFNISDRDRPDKPRFPSGTPSTSPPAWPRCSLGPVAAASSPSALSRLSRPQCACLRPSARRRCPCI